ncbi:Bifunctional uridylyltransferase/uridylyl-removing enzyme (Includes: (Protein-PII) uridylyltransferase; (Protein-PII)-UMP uridylyl-removing enzyme) [Candidatus Terasakiella magnetica]|uniref:Bifunctional uridylyltransferase/uridylyl-removing enzyme n=1 Tax=Candidatus Terasakiella magnetica TaxID=1867952 RepID=A0A1C3RGE9_9PROT|nr:[protein-PII] uridylyltransferase [Candidatus Terasakiella magnetica]SCA56328.1 Bifunctional uridylyltransferase/uridylyl-removing enzyme (Includes: (Protein-PII) uridylyltransferase; (Protein-PII)-UMP uridylyl-removing enzyme) [Candidatus Terasakiella magnetica]
MVKIVKQKDIIDRKALWAELEDMAGWSGYSSKMQKDVLKLFKEVLASGRTEIKTRFETKKANGIVTFHNYAFLIDQIVRTLYDFTTKYVYAIHTPTKAEQFCVAAVGGYGRSEMAPQSDIDLLFLLPYKQTPKVEQAVEYMLYLLWDLGLKVGHSTRNIDECIKMAKDDLTIQTALLDGRYLWGNQELFEDFQTRFKEKVVAGSGRQFVDAKLDERDERHQRMGDTRYVVEPNLKEGKGGLRDLQTLYWIGKYIYGVERWRELVDHDVITEDDAKAFKKSVNFLFSVRCALHYLTNRPQENLSFDVQGQLAETLGYHDRGNTRGVERFMKHYYLTAKTVGDLTRNLCAVLDEQHKKQQQRFAMLTNFFKRNVDGFGVDSGRLRLDKEDAVVENPLLMFKLFQVAQDHDLDIHPFALKQIRNNLKLIKGKWRKDPEVNQMFMDMLTSEKKPQRVLRLMGEVGLLGQFIPDFARVTAQMQYDMYHTYTVDEHTIKAIGELNHIETGQTKEELPVSCGAISEVLSRRALYMAVLLHDIAKGRGGDHSELGAEVAMTLCPRLGLNIEETETVAWLVKHHLTMSHVAFKRDLEDPNLIKKFCAIIQSPERLRLLLILTVCDIRAVGPDVWNGWKGNLLRVLYARAMEVLTGGEAAAGGVQARVEYKQEAFSETIKGWSQDEIADYVALGNAGYWLSFETEVQVRHAELTKRALNEEGAVHIHVEHDTFNNVSEISIYAADHPGLFSVIAGAMALTNGSIVDAKIATLSNGMALDTFSVQDHSGEAFDSETKIKRLADRIDKALKGEIYPANELEKVTTNTLKSRRDVFTVPPRVLIDNKVSNAFTVIEVNGRDRLGFLYDVTRTLSDLGLQINSSHISTYGERAVDVFYVKDVFGLKVNTESKLDSIKSKLLDTITEENYHQPKKRKKKAG